MTQLMEPMLKEFHEEVAITKRVLDRVPADKLCWKPHQKSMTLGALALHIATVPGALARISQLDEFDAAQANFNPPEPKNLEEINAALDESVRVAKECVGGMSDERALGNWRLLVNGKQAFSRPRMEALRSIMLNH
jgi:uncharacterized damage-inducible protein DinB